MIAETEDERAAYALAMRRSGPRPRMTEAEIEAIIGKIADIGRVLPDASPDDQTEVFRQLGLKLDLPSRPTARPSLGRARGL